MLLEVKLGGLAIPESGINMLRLLRPWSLQYASGLYADQGWRRAAAALTPGAGQHLALLGNCGSAATPKQAKETREFLRSCSAAWEKVFWVFGPHEFGSAEKGIVYTAQEDRLREAAAKFPNVHIMNQSEHLLNDDVVLLGATGWSDLAFLRNERFPEGEPETTIYSSYGGYRKPLQPDTMRQWHEEDLEWLYLKANQWATYDHSIYKILLTHHLCSGWLLNRGGGVDTQKRAVLDVMSHASAGDLLQSGLPMAPYAWLCGAGGSCASGIFNNTFAATNTLYGKAGAGAVPNPNYMPDRCLTIRRKDIWRFPGSGDAPVPMSLTPTLA